MTTFFALTTVRHVVLVALTTMRHIVLSLPWRQCVKLFSLPWRPYVKLFLLPWWQWIRLFLASVSQLQCSLVNVVSRCSSPYDSITTFFYLVDVVTRCTFGCSITQCLVLCHEVLYRHHGALPWQFYDCSLPWQQHGTLPWQFYVAAMTILYDTSFVLAIILLLDSGYSVP